MWNVFSQSIRTNNRIEEWHDKLNRMDGWHNKLNRVEGWHHKLNRVEEWHDKLNRAIGHSHPNTHELISVLKKEQTSTEETLQRARLGAPPPPSRRRYRLLEQLDDAIHGQSDTSTSSTHDITTGSLDVSTCLLCLIKITN